MTIQELYDSVAQLGFETSLEDDDRFYFAVNRSIKQVGRIRPATKIYKLSHFPLANIVAEDTKNPVEGACSFAGSGAKAYYFEANGNGTATIEKRNSDGTYSTLKTITLTSSNGVFVAYKGKVLDGTAAYLGDIRIRFSGDYLYYVRNVALYAKLLSADEADIPAYDKYKSYKLSSLTNDFLSFVCPPIVDAIREDGFILGQDYFVEGKDTLLLPVPTSGVFDVKYERERVTVSASDDMSTEIDLDSELSELLPLLVASYIWADDEPAKAEYYLNLYREQENYLRIKERELSSVKIRNKSGW